MAHHHHKGMFYYLYYFFLCYYWVTFRGKYVVIDYYYYRCKLDIRGKVRICNVQAITRQYTIYYIRTQVTYKTYGRTQVKYKVHRARDPKDTQST